MESIQANRKNQNRETKSRAKKPYATKSNPQEHREATTIKAKSTGNESHRSHEPNENP